MQPLFILRRIRQQWRVLGVLLAAMCLVTGFFALGPLYLRYTNEVLLRFLLDQGGQDNDKIALFSSIDFDDADAAILDRTIGFMIEDIWPYERSVYDTSEDRIPSPCNFSLDHCNQLLAFGPYFQELITVVEGRLPEPAPLREDVTSDRAPVLEAVITTEVAERAELFVGIEYELTGPVGTTRVVEIVGIVEVNDPQATFWSGNRLFVTGGEVERLIPPPRYDFGFVIHPQSYTEWADPVITGTTYAWFVDTDTSLITAENAEDVQASLFEGLRQIDGRRPEPVRSIGPLPSILQTHASQLADAEGTIILLSAALLLLMLYSLMTMARFTFRTRLSEWSMLRSRGSSFYQLLQLQLVPALGLSIIAGIAGIFLTRIFLLVIGAVGPFSNTDQHVDIVQSINTPEVSYGLSAIAAVLCAAVFVYPVFEAANLDFLEHKRSISRPAEKPRWAARLIDFMLLIMGGLLMVRLYLLVGGSLGDLIRHSPSDIVREITAESDATDAFKDYFSLLAPALILTGGALLWLRLFAYFMHGVAAVVRRARTLNVPLAVWNVERNTGHYGQFALVLIGTLAVGIASLGLQNTQQDGAWKVARLEVGGHARLELDSEQADLVERPWRQIAGVRHVAETMSLDIPTNQDVTQNDLQIFGVDPQQVHAVFPELDAPVGQLEELPLVGVQLSPDARELMVEAWATPSTNDLYPDLKLSVNAHLYDVRGLAFVVVLEHDGAITEPGEWVTLRGTLPTSESARLPLYLWRIGMGTVMGESRGFSHTAYLSNWQTVDADGAVTTLPTQDANWATALSTRPFIGPWTLDNPFHRPPSAAEVQRVEWEGQPALQVDYTIQFSFATNRPNEPSMTVNTALIEPIPVIVSERFTESLRGDLNEPMTMDVAPLQVGDERSLSLNLGSSGNLLVRVRIAAIADEFPTLSDAPNHLFMVMPRRSAQLLINQRFEREAQLVDINQIWLSLAERNPASTARMQLAEAPGVAEASFAWTRYSTILREPVSNTMAGMLFAGFWISLILSLINFAFYIAVTARQRSFSFGILRALGWNINNIWRLLAVEQLVFIIPALLVGGLLGALLAFLLVPFMPLPGSVELRLPLMTLASMMLLLTLGFLVLLSLASIWLRRMSVNEVLRAGEE